MKVLLVFLNSICWELQEENEKKYFYFERFKSISLGLQDISYSLTSCFVNDMARPILFCGEIDQYTKYVATIHNILLHPKYYELGGDKLVYIFFIAVVINRM